jgi:shikimate kinase
MVRSGGFLARLLETTFLPSNSDPIPAAGSCPDPACPPESRAGARALDRAVVLVGLMGAGKSCIGKRLAQRLGVPFMDADAEIEQAAGLTIAEMFAKYGEAAFRDGERRVMARLLQGPPGVLSAGGGAFMDPETRRLIKERGISIWLRADLDTLVARTKGRTHRPLLNNGDPRETLAEMMRVRHPVYAEADIVVDSGLDNPNVTSARVNAALDSFLARPKSGAPEASS